MATLREGLGGEEISPSGLEVAAITQPFFIGSVTATDKISGLSVFAAGSLTGGRVTDANGRIFSVSNGSPGAFGALIQVGSFATSAGSTAAVLFRTNFTTANAYVFFAQPDSGLGLGALGAGSLNVFTSGTANNGKNTSGANVVGAASVVYSYIAIGV